MDDARGINGKFTVKKVDGSVGDLEFEALTAAGVEVASQTLQR